MAFNIKPKDGKKLNKKDLFFMAMGTTIGAGIITNTGVAIGMSGSGVIIAYLLAFIVIYIGNLPNLLFATVHPVASPAYVSTTYLNKKVAGFWLYCQVFAALGQAYMGTAFGTYIASICGIDPTLAACVIVTVFFFVNLLGLKDSAKIQNITTAVLLVTLISFVALGLPKCNLNEMFQSQNLLYGGWRGIFNACALVLFGVGGCSVLANYGPQMEDPHRNIPLMSNISYFCAFLAFGLVAFVGSGVAPIAEVAGKPMTYQAQIIYPGNGYLLFVIGGALLAICTTMNSNYARYWSSVIRGVDEGWLPAFMGKRNKNDIPWVMMIFFWLMALIPNIIGLNIGQLSSLAAAVTLIPMMIPVWGFVDLPEHNPEEWANCPKLSKIFATRASRILFCAVCCGTLGVFIVLNMLNLNKTTLILCIAFFVIAAIVCFGFGDKLMEKGAKRVQK